MEAEIRKPEESFENLFGEDSAGGTQTSSKKKIEIAGGERKIKKENIGALSKTEARSLKKMRTGEPIEEHRAKIDDVWGKDTEPKIIGLEE